MEEIHRIAKPGALIKITQPYFRSVWNYADPLAKNFGTVHSFSFYDPSDPIFLRYRYTDIMYDIEDIKFNEGLNNNFLTSLLICFANKYPRKYELYISHLAPLSMITTYLRKV
jgi:hypothetical protein